MKGPPKRNLQAEVYDSIRRGTELKGLSPKQTAAALARLVKKGAVYVDPKTGPRVARRVKCDRCGWHKPEGHDTCEECRKFLHPKKTKQRKPTKRTQRSPK
jgi:tRNA(Ile)-lysidine synthase TilS/MesJ